MALNYTGTTYGKVTLKQGENKYTIDIREANCLCAFIYVRKATKEELEYNPEGKYYHSLYSFYSDEQHIKNILKNNDGKPLWDEVIDIKLNMYYKPCWILFKYFTKAGYKCICTYTEPKKK